MQIGRNLLGSDNNTIPLVTELFGNYPNPFNPTTRIKFSLKSDSFVKLTIYNIKGQKIKELINKHLDAGYYNIIWDGDDSNGKKVASGVYFYRFSAGKYSKIGRMILMK